MIEIAKAEDIARLIGLDDSELMECFAGDRGEIVQFFVQQAGNPNIRIWTNKTDGRIDAYLIAINNKAKPISDYIFIAYCYSKAGSEITNQLLDAVKSWANELNVNKIQMATKHDRLFSQYGFQLSDYKIMELNING